MLSPSNVCWPFKKSDCPLVAPRVFCNANGVFKLASLDNAIEYAVGFFYVKMNVICRDLAVLAMMATF